MQNITIIDKASLNKINTDSSNILLDKVSIIQTKLYKDDIAEIIQNGNDLVIKLKNGETITLENYFVKDANGQTSDLVFEGTVCAFEQMVWEDGVAVFNELTGLEELLPIVTGNSGGIGGLPWIIGGVVAGGIGAVVGGGSSNGDNKADNDAPTATTDPVITAEDEPVIGKVTGIDIDGDDLTYVVAEPPKHGTVTIDPETGDYTYTPNPDFNGEDKFTVTVDDGKGGTTTIEVPVTVTPVNDAPTATTDPVITAEDEPVIGKVTGTDIDGDDLTYVVAEPPKNGTVTIDPETGDYTYTPNPDFNGEDKFTVTVDDGKGGKTTVEIPVTVTPVNDAPTAEAEPKTTPEDQPVSGKVVGTDVDGDNLTYVVTEPPKNGTVTIDPETGDYTYTPNPDFNGEDKFTVTVDDGKGGKTTVEVPVTVTPVNDAPTADPEQDTTTAEDTPVKGTIEADDIDL
ncbi:tandem-95 repeat protein, partial [Acinetobacter sp. ANC 3832]|uniref:tandem-95 repeat protein n=1 Tax=Acinetobacter sp. ANC 3832 TaxID=1977874 RepID=UPI000B713F6E